MRKSRLIKDGKDRILNIAEGVNKDLIFRLLKLNFPQNSNGIYVFGIEVGGHILGKRIKPRTTYFHIIFEKLYNTFAGGAEKSYGDSDFAYDTSLTDGFDEYTQGSFRKLEIKQGKPDEKGRRNQRLSKIQKREVCLSLP